MKDVKEIFIIWGTIAWERQVVRVVRSQERAEQLVAELQSKRDKLHERFPNPDEVGCNCEAPGLCECYDEFLQEKERGCTKAEQELYEYNEFGWEKHRLEQ